MNRWPGASPEPLLGGFQQGEAKGRESSGPIVEVYVVLGEDARPESFQLTSSKTHLVMR